MIFYPLWELTNILEVHIYIYKTVHVLCFLCFLLSNQTYRSTWSQTANRPWTSWRKASPTESRQQPTTTTPAADPTPSSPSSTHRSSSPSALLSDYTQLHSSPTCNFSDSSLITLVFPLQAILENNLPSETVSKINLVDLAGRCDRCFLLLLIHKSKSLTNLPPSG